MQTTREAGMMTITGSQGVGKTYLNQYIIYDYTRDKIATRVRGRKCLIFDTNGEFTRSQFDQNGIKDFDAKTLALSDVGAWSRSGIVECRRIDASKLSIAEKKTAIEYIMKNFRNGMLVLEDVNTYILNVTHMENIVSGLVNLRHRAVDVMISYQSLRPVEPRIWQNSRWVRMHYQADNVTDIKGKLNDPRLFKIAQLIVNQRYHSGDKRFYVYIHVQAAKIEGNFSLGEFEEAARKFVLANKRELKEHAAMNRLTEEVAMDEIIADYVKQYYGNDDL